VRHYGRVRLELVCRVRRELGVVPVCMCACARANLSARAEENGGRFIAQDSVNPVQELMNLGFARPQVH